MNRRMLAATSLSIVVVAGLAACGGGTNESNNNNQGTNTPAFNAAMGKVFNPSDKKGGTIKVANSGDWDSLDPGETYYGYSWDFLRLYARPLLIFKPTPGAAGNDLTADLAEGLGQHSDDSKTWTYKIRQGVKFEDGTPVTSKDVKYAVLRSVDKQTFPNGPAYFEQFLNLPDGYKGPYKSKGVNTDQAISTPDDQTIVFHLKVPLANFDYLAQLPQTAPVPEAKDTGAKYRNHVIATGPYMFDTNQPGKGFTLKRNPNWDQATDPNRKALPDGFQVSINVNADDIDNRMISGDLQIDVSGTGAQPASLSRVVGDPNLKARADNPIAPRLWYVSVDPQVAPLDNIECRKAVQYATDKVSYQTAYGGPLSGGEIASTLLPPMIPGYQKFDLYPSGPDNKGDLARQRRL